MSDIETVPARRARLFSNSFHETNHAPKVPPYTRRVLAGGRCLRLLQLQGSLSEARVSDRVENSDPIVPDLGSSISTGSELFTC